MEIRNDTQSVLSAHDKPPGELKSVFKFYQKASAEDMVNDASLRVDGEGKTSGFRLAPAALEKLQVPSLVASTVSSDRVKIADTEATPFNCYEHPELPGLCVFPSLLPPALQLEMLDALLHRDVANPVHGNNLDLHYTMNPALDDSGRPLSFFDPAHETTVLQPRTPAAHPPVTMRQVLDKKLRWTTLGGQYDWTAKRYPPSAPPPFPADLGAALRSLFPAVVEPEAAILNLYSPGHTLSLHRDVAEGSDAPLISVSFGCECVFVAGLDGGGQAKAVRLRSGDVVVMSGRARRAWHGVPRVLAGTCPSWLEQWPCIAGRQETQKYAHYRGWMAGKRINLNVRQMT